MTEAPDQQRLENVVDAAFAADATNPLTETLAFVAYIDGEIVHERYADGFDETSTFISWSMAKSMLAAACGILVRQGRLDIDAPAAVDEWQSPGDARAAITVRHLLEMRSGLAWVEDYVDDGVSDVIQMLFSDEVTDAASFAASKPLEAPPGELWKYSSGTTNILARLIGDIIGAGSDGDRAEGMRAFLADELFGPTAMSSPTMRFDAAGTWLASSFVFATARDFAAFGELHRNDGVTAEGRRILPEGWVDLCTTSHATDEESGEGYGLQWWLANDGFGSYSCNGYNGQRIQVTPPARSTFVRLGKTPDDFSIDLRTFYRDVTSCLQL